MFCIVRLVSIVNMLELPILLLMKEKVMDHFIFYILMFGDILRFVPYRYFIYLFELSC